ADLGCASRALEQAHVDLGLRVIVNLALDPPILIINVIDAKAQKSLGESVADIDVKKPLAEALEKGVDDALNSAGFRVGGRLRVAATPDGCRIKVGAGARPDPRSPSEFLLPAGRYDVEVTR